MPTAGAKLFPESVRIPVDILTGCGKVWVSGQRHHRPEKTMKTMQAATADARKNCHPKVIASVIVYQTEAGRWHWCTAESPVGVSLQTAGVYNRSTNERAQQWQAVNLW